MRYIYCALCGAEIYDGEDYFEIPRVGKVCVGCADEARDVNWADEDEEEGGESDGDNKRSN